jgi:DNA-binding transcriptional ArsR family regulator
MENRVILDEKSFKALSADSRISILKNLTDRRRTLTELSQKLSLGSSTIKEHCDILVGAELIKQIDEGRKWKYYELTPKGKQIIHPSLMEEVKVLIMLSLGVFLVGGFVFLLLQTLTATPTALNYNTIQDSAPLLKSTALNEVANPVLGASADTNELARTTGEAITNTVPQVAPIIQGISMEAYTISILIAIVAGIIIGWYFTRKK